MSTDMEFSEWFKAVRSMLVQQGVTKVALSMDDFTVVIGNYWDGMTPKDQVKWLKVAKGV